MECAERVEWVEVVLRDGHTLQGNVICNPIRQTRTIVNAVAETRYEFALLGVHSVRKVVDPRQLGLS